MNIQQAESLINSVADSINAYNTFARENGLKEMQTTIITGATLSLIDK